MEEAEALERLMKEQSLTQEQLGGIVGKARTTVRDILTLNGLPQTIRDECRGDRIITRQTLIEIARKNPNHPDAVSAFAQKVIKKITGIDPKDWSADEWEQIRTTFSSIKDQIDVFLNPNPEPS